MAAGAAVAGATPALGTAEWLAEFLLSPGPAALAAVVAAVVGFAATRARIRADRAESADGRRVAALVAQAARDGEVEDRDLTHWWAVYRWVAEQDEACGTVSRATVLMALGDAVDDPVRSALVTLALQRGRTIEERCDDA